MKHVSIFSCFHVVFANSENILKNDGPERKLLSWMEKKRVVIKTMVSDDRGIFGEIEPCSAFSILNIILFSNRKTKLHAVVHRVHSRRACFDIHNHRISAKTVCGELATISRSFICWHITSYAIRWWHSRCICTSKWYTARSNGTWHTALYFKLQIDFHSFFFCVMYILIW